MVDYSNEYLIEALQECKDKHGKITTQVLNNDNSLPSGPTYSYRFDSLADAARRAGLDDEADRMQTNRKRRIGYSDDEIKSFIKSISYDGLVTPKIIDQADGPSTTTISNHLGSDTIVGESIAGVDIISHRDYKNISK